MMLYFEPIIESFITIKNVEYLIEDFNLNFDSNFYDGSQAYPFPRSAGPGSHLQVKQSVRAF